MEQLKQKWLIEANQLLLQLGVTPENRQVCLVKLNTKQFNSRLDILKECLLFARSSENDEYEKISPHADDQELHEAIQRLPFNQKSNLSLHRYYSFSESEIEQLTSLSYKESLEHEQSAITTLADLWQTDRSQIPHFLSLLEEAYQSKQLDPEDLSQPDEKTEEAIKLKEKKSSKWPTVAAGGVLAAAVGTMFLMNDPLPQATEETAGDAVHEAPEEEPEFDDGKLTELDTLIKTRKEELSGALGLNEEEVNSLNVIMNVESQLQYMREINEGYHQGSHGDSEQMISMLTDEIQASTAPPMDMLEAFYELSGEYYGNTEVELSDQTVTMFMNNGQNLIALYENKLNEHIESIAPWNRSYYKDDELPEKEKVLREKIKENGFTYDYDAEEAEFTVTLGGEIFEERTGFLQPAYREFLKNMPPSLDELYQAGSVETEPDYWSYAVTALELEHNINDFYQLESESKRENSEIPIMLGLPQSLNFHYSELIRSLVTGNTVNHSRTYSDLREEQLEVWERILEDEAFEGSYIREMIAFQYRIGEESQFDMPSGWSDIEFAPFFTKTGIWHESGHSTHTDVPLQDYLKEVYETYVFEKNQEAIRLLHPKFIILFYFHALEQKDYEVAYSLMGGEALPEFGRFEKVVSEQKYEFESVRYIVGGTSGGLDTEAIFTIQINGTETGITLILEDDMYKVKYIRDGMFNLYETKEEEDAPI
ncbi:hypothetical protein [Jeotgalibacillus salarius]|uniref:Uncharacterized protein n=1 Tax=Jeotgalibacillus salarius TaxID=546023 RepID=A0A4Y8LME6_9BACL|nr:hypothetical protein [Jeotgalibacillus salarius]TFE03763.1 hypothetical protein E2626_00080 [Jeotgalibacillus salarius]